MRWAGLRLSLRRAEKMISPKGHAANTAVLWSFGILTALSVIGAFAALKLERR